MIPEAKRRGLTEALRDGAVRFKNGSIVERDPACAADLIVRLPVMGAERRTRVNEYAHDQIAQAYEIALAGPLPPKPPPPAKHRTLPARDWGPCPF